MAKIFSVCLKTGFVVHSPLVSFKFSQKKIHKGLGKTSRHFFFFSVFATVKSSEGIRSRRKGREDVGMVGKCP